MAITEAFSGSSSISTTEFDLTTSSTTLGAQSVDGIYQIFMDLSALTSADSFRFRIYEKTRSASASQKLVEEVIFTGAQSEPLYVTPALLFLHGWTATLTRLQGADRTIEWSVRSVA